MSRGGAAASRPPRAISCMFASACHRSRTQAARDTWNSSERVRAAAVGGRAGAQRASKTAALLMLKGQGASLAHPPLLPHVSVAVPHHMSQTCGTSDMWLYAFPCAISEKPNKTKGPGYVIFRNYRAGATIENCAYGARSARSSCSTCCSKSYNSRLFSACSPAAAVTQTLQRNFVRKVHARCGQLLRTKAVTQKRASPMQASRTPAALPPFSVRPGIRTPLERAVAHARGARAGASEVKCKIDTQPHMRKREQQKTARFRAGASTHSTSIQRATTGCNGSF